MVDRSRTIEKQIEKSLGIFGIVQSEPRSALAICIGSPVKSCLHDRLGNMSVVGRDASTPLYSEHITALVRRQSPPPTLVDGRLPRFSSCLALQDAPVAIASEFNAPWMASKSPLAHVGVSRAQVHCTASATSCTDRLLAYLALAAVSASRAMHRPPWITAYGYLKDLPRTSCIAAIGAAPYNERMRSRNPRERSARV